MQVAGIQHTIFISLSRKHNIFLGTKSVLISFNFLVRGIILVVHCLSHSFMLQMLGFADIDKTLAALDHVIGYYHVAEEVEPMIRDGYVL